MRKFFVMALILFWPFMAMAASTVGFIESGGSPSKIVRLEYTLTSHTDGTVTATSTDAKADAKRWGVIVGFEIVPDATTPPNDAGGVFNVVVPTTTDSGKDLLQTLGTGVSNSSGVKKGLYDSYMQEIAGEIPKPQATTMGSGRKAKLILKLQQL